VFIGHDTVPTDDKILQTLATQYDMDPAEVVNEI
jgi:hypothetical protein